MLYDHPLKRICGDSPELKRREIPPSCSEPYFYYECEQCCIITFATRKEEYCRELWNSTIIKKNERK